MSATTRVSDAELDGFANDYPVSVDEDPADDAAIADVAPPNAVPSSTAGGAYRIGAPPAPGTADGAAIRVSEQVVKDDDLDKASVDQLLAAVNDPTVVLPEPSASWEVCFR